MRPLAAAALTAAALERRAGRDVDSAVSVRRCFMLAGIAALGLRRGIVPVGADVVNLVSRNARGAVVRVPRGLTPACRACSFNVDGRCLTLAPILRPDIACISRLN